MDQSVQTGSQQPEVHLEVWNAINVTVGRADLIKIILL